MKKGWQGPTVERITLAAKVNAMRLEGFTHRQVAERLGISRSYAAELALDPDGSLARARKDSYSGVCIDCGAPTCGSDGPNAAPERCATCAPIALKVWTREAVIEAIQRWAAIHGRPPTADDWLHADPHNGYPNRGSVYQGSTNHTSPFPRWADAIEAAGYPRPYVGHKTGTRRRRDTMPTGRYGYTVLREREDGLWEVVKVSDKPNRSLALNDALNGHNPEEGRWVAVPGGDWQPRKLAPRTIYEFVEDTAA